MSDALLQVRFPDGTVRFGCYHGTTDSPYNALVEDPARWLESRAWVLADDDGGGASVPVEIATNYGGGSHWKGTAKPSHLVDLGLFWPDDGWSDPYIRDRKDGLPEWWEVAP